MVHFVHHTKRGRMKLLVFMGIWLCVSTSSGAPSPPKEFDHHMVIVADEYNLYWTVKDDFIFFQVQVKTLGYVGLGISPNGGMAGADIITAWVKDDIVYFQDRYATRNGQPQVDEEQNWSMIEGAEMDGYTIVTFKRPLVSCDRVNDRDINDDTIRLIYAYHPDDPKDAASIVYHGSKTRGAKSVTLLVYGAQKTVHEIPPNTKHFDFVNPAIEIPAKPTTYWCQAFKLPELAEKHHVVRFEPIIQQDQGIVHHMVMYSCLHDFDEEVHDGRGAECYQHLMREVEDCNAVAFGWGVGGPAMNFPDNVGYPIGGGLKPKMMLLEVHYDNPSSKRGMLDSSGIRIYYTKNLRQFDAGFLIAVASNNRIIIPPNFQSLTIQAHCTKECLSKAIPENEDIKIFAAGLHSHLLGIKLRVRHIRDGKELPPVVKDDNYDFNYQDIKVLPEEVSIKPNDHLLVECDYKSRENITYGGIGTFNEMCVAYLMYYPKRAFSRCISVTNPSDYLKIINPTLEFNENDHPIRKFFNFNITAPEKYAYKNPREVMNMIDWEDSTVREMFQSILLEDELNILQICDDGDNRRLLKNPFVKTPKIVETYEAPEASCSAGFVIKASGIWVLLLLGILVPL